jgi:hypothetical protein
MGTRCGIFLACVAAISLTALTANSQESPSLGDLARQQRQQKDQSKATPGKAAKPSKVITNEEIPEHTERASATAAHHVERTSAPDSSSGPKLSAEQWRSQIVTQKNQLASLQAQFDQLNESIRFAPANCVENCVGWNERQREKQQQAERMQAQLEDQKRRLEDTQDAARKQGYGSSVYDP